MQDSVRTDKISTLIIGSIKDPIFGTTTSGCYIQPRLSAEGTDFGTQPVLDSLVLMLYYTGYYGDTLTRQNVKVYEISQDFVYDSVRFSNQHLETYGTLLANQDFIPHLSDSVSIFGVKTAPHLRINLSKLTNYLGQKILDAPESALKTNTAFINFMKGLYVTATPVNSKGALINFTIANGISKMVAYFHDAGEAGKDSLHFDMPVNEASARFLHFDHNGYLDANQDVKRQLLNKDSAQGAKQVFIQGMGGIKVKIKFPYFKNFGLGKVIAINDAVLEFVNQEASTDTILSPPVSLTIMRQDSAGRVGYLVDANEGTSYFGGGYMEDTRSYKFRVTRHLQKILLNSYSTSFDLYMMTGNPGLSTTVPNRVVLNGTNPLMPGDAGRLKLKVTYTVLN
jgi:hypothetical protein